MAAKIARLEVILRPVSNDDKRMSAADVLLSADDLTPEGFAIILSCVAPHLAKNFLEQMKRGEPERSRGGAFQT